MVDVQHIVRLVHGLQQVTDVQKLPTPEELLLPGFQLTDGEQSLLRYPEHSFLFRLPA